MDKYTIRGVLGSSFLNGDVMTAEAMKDAAESFSRGAKVCMSFNDDLQAGITTEGKVVGDEIRLTVELDVAGVIFEGIKSGELVPTIGLIFDSEDLTAVDGVWGKGCTIKRVKDAWIGIVRRENSLDPHARFILDE